MKNYDAEVGCFGKETFDDFTIAQRAATRRPNRRVYKCPICGQYHVGGHIKPALGRFRRQKTLQLSRGFDDHV